MCECKCRTLHPKERVLELQHQPTITSGIQNPKTAEKSLWTRLLTPCSKTVGSWIWIKNNLLIQRSFQTRLLMLDPSQWSDWFVLAHCLPPIMLWCWCKVADWPLTTQHTTTTKNLSSCLARNALSPRWWHLKTCMNAKEEGHAMMLDCHLLVRELQQVQPGSNGQTCLQIESCPPGTSQRSNQQCPEP